MFHHLHAAIAAPGRVSPSRISAIACAVARPRFAAYPFALGVASGSPRPEGMVLWTRIAPKPLEGGGMPMSIIDVEWEIARDARGYVLTGDDVVKAGRWSHGRDPYLLESSVPGIFACGDVRLSPVKRVASAVGEGSMAIAFVHKYLQQDAP